MKNLILYYTGKHCHPKYYQEKCKNVAKEKRICPFTRVYKYTFVFLEYLRRTRKISDKTGLIYRIREQENDIATGLEYMWNTRLAG